MADMSKPPSIEESRRASAAVVDQHGGGEARGGMVKTNRVKFATPEATRKNRTARVGQNLSVGTLRVDGKGLRKRLRSARTSDSQERRVLRNLNASERRRSGPNDALATTHDL